MAHDPTESSLNRLDSWKAIAAYLRRDVTTVQRWEKREAMPVHRHRHEKAGSVYAFASELDAWSRSRRIRTANHYSASRRWVVLGLVPAIGAAAVVFGVMVFTGATRSAHDASRQTPVAVGVSTEPAARQEYLIGRYYLWRFDEEHLQQAIEHFERATRIDPDCAPAYAALANAWWARALFGQVELKTAALRAHEAAEQAMMLDDRLAAAWVARGDVLRVFDKDAAGAEAMFMQALALDPVSVEAHHSYALLLMGLGRFEQALDHIARAAAGDPLAPAIESNYGRILYRAGRFTEAIPHIERALALEPGMRSHYTRLAEVHEQLGQYDRALAAYDMAGLQGPAYDLRMVAMLARRGNQREARQLLESVERDADRMPLLPAAAAYTALGDINRASGVLRTMIQRDDPGLLYFRVDPQFAQLRWAPQWTELVQHFNVRLQQQRNEHLR